MERVAAVKIPVAFYCTADGNEPARDFLKSLTREDRREVGADLYTLQTEWPIGMPLVRSLNKGLWELRSDLGDRIARLMFCFHQRRIIVLHGFIKKSQKTPQADLDLAIKRLKEVTR
jgi:phage-related protein